jgi:hypothetical protein
MEIIGYLIFTFIGSLLKEIFNTNSVNGYRFQAHRVISSTIAASIASGAIRSIYMQDYSYPVMAFLSFTLGLLGFELFKNLCSIKGIKKLISDFSKIYSALTELPNPNSSKDDNSNPEESLNTSSNPTKSLDNSGFVPTIRIHTSKRNKDDAEG